MKMTTMSLKNNMKKIIHSASKHFLTINAKIILEERL